MCAARATITHGSGTLALGQRQQRRLRETGPAPRLLAAKLGTTHSAPLASQLPSAGGGVSSLPGPLPHCPKLVATPSPEGGGCGARLTGRAVGGYHPGPALGQTQGSGPLLTQSPEQCYWSF